MSLSTRAGGVEQEEGRGGPRGLIGPPNVG